MEKSGGGKKKSKGTKRKRVTPKMGRTRGPHPNSPSEESVLNKIEKLPMSGYVSRNPTGYVFLDLDDDWVFALQEEMEKFGYEVPPYFVGAQAVGAHVTIVPSELGKETKSGDVEIGKKIEFEVVKAGPMFPNRRWYGTEAVYMIWVESEELTRMSKELGGRRYKPLYGGFNIVVGVRSLEKRDEMLDLSD